MKKQTKILLCCFVALVVIAAAVFALTRPAVFGGSKKITVEVVFADGSTKTHNIKTDAEFLYDAVKDIVTGSDSDYGFFVTGVDGYEADAANQEWWSVCDGNGEMLMTGVSTTPIADGDSFQFVLMVGYDF